MEVLDAIITSIASIIILFILTRLMGHRSMSEISLFDYINSITIGSIAAETIIAPSQDTIKPFIAMITYALISILLALLTNKSIKARRFITGKPSILYDHGTLYFKNLSKAKIDINEFLVQCRMSGYFDLANIETAILEPNGQISFLPVAAMRPVIGKDLNLTPSQDYLVANVIIDGNIMQKNLEHTGHNETWLYKQLKAQDITNLKDVLLATCDSNNILRVYKKVTNDMKKDILA